MKKKMLKKILEPLKNEGIDISKIDLGNIEFSMDSALALQREVRMIIMRGQHTTVDLNGEQISLSPEEIGKMLRDVLPK